MLDVGALQDWVNDVNYKLKQLENANKKLKARIKTLEEKESHRSWRA